jgi:hypothetical protein
MESLSQGILSQGGVGYHQQTRYFDEGPGCYNSHMEIKWTDTDPNTGLKRFVRAERFAGRWEFACRRERRGVWEKWRNPGREMWEELLEAMERRLPRGEGVEESDLKFVRRIIAEWREAPEA